MKLIETPVFSKEVKRLAKKFPSLVKELAALCDELEKNPVKGKPLGDNYTK